LIHDPLPVQAGIQGPYLGSRRGRFASLSDKAERINITLPARVLQRIDAAAKTAGETRSGYIARRALAA